jgi:hypothetical protein
MPNQWPPHLPVRSSTLVLSAIFVISIVAYS